MALTDVKVKTAKPKEKPYKLADGGGMYLSESDAGYHCLDTQLQPVALPYIQAGYHPVNMKISGKRLCGRPDLVSHYIMEYQCTGDLKK